MSKTKKFIVGILIIIFLFLHLVPIKQVIVRVKIDPPFQVGLSGQQEVAQERAIAKSSRIVIHTLRFVGVGIIADPYTFIPSFSATVSVTGYLLLHMHPLVESVGENRSYYLEDCTKGPC